MQVSQKEIPASKFEIPAGYQKAELNQKSVDSKQKQHLRNLMEKMKNFEK
jgi:hypothetical protein